LLWGFPLSNTIVLPLDELSVGICQSVEQAVSSSAHTWKQKSQRKTNKQQLLHHVKLIIGDTQAHQQKKELQASSSSPFSE
jgi:hypothetical protein